MENKLVLSALNHTWILDLDGTIVKHNGYKMDGKDSMLESSRRFLQTIPIEDMIIFITSRDEQYKTETEQFLDEQGVRYNHIIYNAPFGERILINDNKPGGLEMAKVISLKRDEGIHLQIEINQQL